MKNIVFIAVLLSVGGALYWYGQQDTPATAEAPSQAVQVPALEEKEPAAQTPAVSSSPENTVTFSCSGGKELTAVFMRDIVGLTLSDGRQFELRQIATESGVKYENAFEKVEFSGTESSTSFFEKGTATYTKCSPSSN